MKERGLDSKIDNHCFKSAIMCFNKIQNFFFKFHLPKASTGLPESTSFGLTPHPLRTPVALRPPPLLHKAKPWLLNVQGPKTFRETDKSRGKTLSQETRKPSCIQF